MFFCAMDGGKLGIRSYLSRELVRFCLLCERVFEAAFIYDVAILVPSEAELHREPYPMLSFPHLSQDRKHIIKTGKNGQSSIKLILWIVP